MTGFNDINLLAPGLVVVAVVILLIGIAKLLRKRASG